MINKIFSKLIPWDRNLKRKSIKPALRVYYETITQKDDLISQLNNSLNNSSNSKIKYKVATDVEPMISQEGDIRVVQFSLAQQYKSPKGFNAFLVGGFVNDGIVKIMNQFLEVEGFYYAFYYDLHYSTSQNIRNWAHYKYSGGLKRIIDKHGQKIVDLSLRPGRNFKLSYQKINLAIGSEYWFANEFFKSVSKDNIANFCRENNLSFKQNESNIEMVLYEDLRESWTPEVQAIQTKFRNFLIQNDSGYSPSLLRNVKSKVNDNHFTPNKWYAIKSSDAEGILEKLGVIDSEKTNWVDGYRQARNVDKTFLTNSIGGYCLLLGRNLPEPTVNKGVSEVMNLLNQMSIQFDEAVYFAYSSTVDLACWIKSINGEQQRLYIDVEDFYVNRGDTDQIEDLFEFTKHEEEKIRYQIDYNDILKIATEWSSNPNLYKIVDLNKVGGFIF